MAKILIVEDSPTISLFYQELFKKNGYEVLVASDGLSALNLATKEVPNLVLLDIMLPGMNGIKVCAMLKKSEVLESMKVVMLTGNPNEKELGKEVGADEYLTKDCEPSQVLKVVKRLLLKPDNPL
ncbi:MAG: response regulator [Chlamydiae bacterium]|nr:response regulator [Chlamydiota bacterium]MBI3276704.1 response regulator [Chlamydiota bacterium]